MEKGRGEVWGERTFGFRFVSQMTISSYWRKIRILYFFSHIPANALRFIQEQHFSHYLLTHTFSFQLYQCFLTSGHQGTTVSQSQLQDVLIKTGEKVLDIKTLKMFKIRTWYRTEAISREEWANMVLDRNSVCTMIHLQVNPSHGLGESIAFIGKKENVHLA